MKEIINDEEELLRRGVVSNVPLPANVDWSAWAERIATPTPMNRAFESDNEFPLYRNLLDEPNFPLETILTGNVRAAVATFFGVDPDELRLDDAFCVHYHMDQLDTTGAKHMDPSDITVNMCLVKSPDCKGSHVLFHGTKELATVRGKNNNDGNSDEAAFMVEQMSGFATLHWGNHPHETTRLEAGQRTNVIATYCFKDPRKSGASTRSCYNV